MDEKPTLAEGAAHEREAVVVVSSVELAARNAELKQVKSYPY